MPRKARPVVVAPQKEEVPANYWLSKGDTFWPGDASYERLPAGLYRISYSQQVGWHCVKARVTTDVLIPLPDTASAEVMAEIRRFWELENAFRKRGLLWKRGVLLWGPPGSGKTATVQQLLHEVITEHDGIAIYIDGAESAMAGFQMIRKMEPHRPIVALMEDIEALIEEDGDAGYLALLDGEAQVDNVVFVATTNFPEKLGARFTDRPSRFDIVRKVGMPSAVARRAFLLAKEPELETEGGIDTWVNMTENMSIAHLRELIILCRCYGSDLETALARLNTMREKQPSSTAPGYLTVGDKQPAAQNGAVTLGYAKVEYTSRANKAAAPEAESMTKAETELMDVLMQPVN